MRLYGVEHKISTSGLAVCGELSETLRMAARERPSLERRQINVGEGAESD